ncbi:heterogeneous nuclear ribonucleoprotein 1-like [Silene latifolia]|uniref:heterogeneous nuclear ribonucleoprotein 1-like n=1 Tax=Silene latifolia TaxID=37657 RepID=UPI003D770721
MEAEEGKLFVGGITWETTEDTLRDHFSKYGDVTNAVVMRDKTTGRPRGFAFVHFSNPSSIDSLLQDKHTIDGRMVEAKRALSREDQSAFRQDSSQGARGTSGGGGNIRTKKIFVGGLPPTLTDEEFRQYFENFGQVTDAVIMYDQSTQRPRGFGFISFDTEDAVDRVLQKNFHDLNGKDVEVKRALPKDANSGSGNRGGGYQNYGSSRGNSGSYDNRMDGNRYMQPQSASFSSYPGYNAAGYGGAYGGPTGGYGGYGGYGGGYGGAAGAFAAQAGGYGAGAASAMKAAWSNQAAGYGSSGYGAGYGPTAGYGSGASAQTGQTPAGGPGYGNQAYGGGYGASGYGSVGGRAGSGPTGNGDGGDQSAAGSGYMGSGYGEHNRNAGYGGYDAQSWQGQQ